MYVLTAWTEYPRIRRAGELTITLELEGGMRELGWTWTGSGLTSGGYGGWEAAEDGGGYFLKLIDQSGEFAWLYSALWAKALQNKYRGQPPLPWFPRHRGFKGTMFLVPTVQRLEWELF
jgi:hypothetical protein